MFYDKTQLYNAGTLDTSGANAIVFAPGQPVHVKRVIFVTTVAHTVANATISVAVRDVDNGNSVAIGSFVVPYSGSAADDVGFANIAANQTGPTTLSGNGISAPVWYDGGAGDVLVVPGQEISLTSDGGGDAGTYQVYFEYVPTGFKEADADRKFTYTTA